MLSNNQAKLSKQSITADTTIRIVLLTLQGCTTFTHMIISYRLCTRHHSRGAGEDAHHNCYLIADIVHESRLPRLVSNCEPVGFTEVDPDDVCVVQKPVSDEPVSHLATRPQAYQKSELLRHLDIEGDDLVS